MLDYDFTGCRALLADDIPVNIRIAKHYLKHCGFEVDCAHNGKEAVELFESSECGGYSVIVLDIRMPVMNGYEAARKIRASDRPDARCVPIIALSADAMPQDVEKALASGMNEHIAKPCEYECLIHTLHRLIYEYKN